MGGCLTAAAREEGDSRARKRISERIDQQLQALSLEETRRIKILLLGAGESGKSTLVKQMKIIHTDGFSTDELLSFRPTIMDNLVASMKYVLTGMGLLRINLESIEHRQAAKIILTCETCFDSEFRMNAQVAASLQTLWSDKGVRLAVARGYEYQLNDSALYLFENLARICSVTYKPTARDVLRARVRTNGVLETDFSVGDRVIRMVDVGGQRSQRFKWIQCFDGVHAVLFVAALSAYDLTLLEDPTENRLVESRRLFSQICNNRFFRDSKMVLFLNKLDLFREKILYSDRHLRKFLTEYSGKDRDVDAGALFIQNWFLNVNQNRTSSKRIYVHFCTATDTSHVQVLFHIIMDTVLENHMTSTTLV